MIRKFFNLKFQKQQRSTVANLKIIFFSLKPGKGDRCQITSYTGIRGTKPQSATTTELMFFEEYPLFIFSIVVDDGCFWERLEARKWIGRRWENHRSPVSSDRLAQMSENALRYPLADWLLIVVPVCSSRLVVVCYPLEPTLWAHLFAVRYRWR